MRTIIRFALVFLIMMAGTGWAGIALAAGGGSISGQVANKTAGGSPVGPIEVTLTTYVSGNTTPGQQKATTDTDGKFTFKGLSVDAVTTYTVGITFQDADYVSPTITLTSDNASQTVELLVYDSTTSDENIQVSNGHIVVFAGEGALEVLEVWRFSNIGNKTYIGTKKDTLRFTLPAGATTLSPVQGTIKSNAAGAVYTVPVPPGFTDINFTYFVPFEGSSVAISRKADYPIADFHLLVQETGVKVTSTVLSSASTQDINGTKYLDLRASNLARGTALDASFSGITRAPTSAGGNAAFPWLWLLIGVGLLGVAVIMAYPRLRNRPALAEAGPSVQSPVGRDDEEALLNELAKLDDAHDAGAIDEKEYREHRARAKARLVQRYSQIRRH